MEGIYLTSLYSFGCHCRASEPRINREISNFLREPLLSEPSSIKATLEELDSFLFYKLIALANQRKDFSDQERDY